MSAILSITLSIILSIILSIMVSDTPHYENRQVGEANEVPFEVPEGWEWTTLGKLCSFLSRGKSPKYSEERKYPVFAQKCNLYDGDISLEKARFLDPETISKWSDEYKIIDGDILVNSTGTGTVGRTRLFHSDVLGDYPFVVPDSHVSVVRSFEEIESKFVLAFLSSDYGQTYIEDNLAGSTNQKELYIGVLDNMQFPLPPHEEQFRIVTTVDKWFTLIDTLESAKEDLQTSIAHAKSKILDLAIHGKLVPQDTNDEPAIELLKRINPKFTPCDNAHYENLPKGWTVCALEEIIDYEQPQAYIVQSVDYKSHYKTPVLTAGKSFIIGYTNESEGVFTNLPVIIFDDFTTDSKFVDFPFKVKSSAMKILHVKEDVNIQYVCWFMSITRLIGDTHKRYWISEYSKLHIPIPPKKEQDIIINKVNELFLILDNISAYL